MKYVVNDWNRVIRRLENDLEEMRSASWGRAFPNLDFYHEGKTYSDLVRTKAATPGYSDFCRKTASIKTRIET